MHSMPGMVDAVIVDIFVTFLGRRTGAPAHAMHPHSLTGPAALRGRRWPRRCHQKTLGTTDRCTEFLAVTALCNLVASSDGAALQPPEQRIDLSAEALKLAQSASVGLFDLHTAAGRQMLVVRALQRSYGLLCQRDPAER